jgi:hypothetical protein
MILPLYGPDGTVTPPTPPTPKKSPIMLGDVADGYDVVSKAGVAVG